jgi:cobalt-zinc-cadmium efflux system membrane fusion protein
MKKTTKSLLLISIAAIASGIVLYAQQRSAKQEAAEEKPKAASHDPGVVRFERGAPQLSAIRAEVVKAEPMPAADPVNGRFVYDENATSRVSSPLVGRVIGLRAGVGDVLPRGAALLDVDSPDLANAEADLAKASSDETRKRLAFERSKRLHENDVIARKEFELAEADYQQAQADTRRTALRLRSLQASGHENGKFVLRSPIAGVVVERNANPGQEVRPDLGAPLFLISDISRLWILVDVPEKSLGHIHVGQTVGVEADAYPDQHFVATVERIGVAVDPVTRRVQVRCAVKNASGKLKPEMFARVSFLADGERKGIRVPNTALVTEGIYVYVFVEKALGVFEKRKVGLALRGNDHSFVDTGLAEGEDVVVEGALLLNSEADADAK